jgi:hypothetical protein
MDELPGGTLEAADRQDSCYRLSITDVHVRVGHVPEHQPGDGASTRLVDEVEHRTAGPLAGGVDWLRPFRATA